MFGGGGRRRGPETGRHFNVSGRWSPFPQFLLFLGDPRLGWGLGVVLGAAPLKARRPIQLPLVLAPRPISVVPTCNVCLCPLGMLGDNLGIIALPSAANPMALLSATSSVSLSASWKRRHIAKTRRLLVFAWSTCSAHSDPLEEWNQPIQRRRGNILKRSRIKSIRQVDAAKKKKKGGGDLKDL